MFAIFIECTLKSGKVFEQDGGPVKFVNDEADAKAFCGNPENDYLLKVYDNENYRSAEFVYKEWSLADYAEYSRQMFEAVFNKINNVGSSIINAVSNN